MIGQDKLVLMVKDKVAGSPSVGFQGSGEVRSSAVGEIYNTLPNLRNPDGFSHH